MKKIYIIILIALISYLVPTTAKASSTSQEEIIQTLNDYIRDNVVFRRNYLDKFY